MSAMVVETVFPMGPDEHSTISTRLGHSPQILEKLSLTYHTNCMQMNFSVTLELVCAMCSDGGCSRWASTCDYISSKGEMINSIQVTFFVFDPTLVYNNLSSTITFKLMVSLWFMPINILLTFILGSLLGWAVIQITRAPSSFRSLIFGCCSASLDSLV